MNSFPSVSPPQQPPVSTTTSSSIIADTRRLIEDSRRQIGQIVSNTTIEKATFQNVVSPLAHCRSSLASGVRILCFYKDVSADANSREASREASRKSQALFDQFDREIGLREDLYVLFRSVADRGQEFEPEAQRLLRFEQRNFLNNGLGLPAGASRIYFEELKARLNEVTAEFRQNMVEECGSVEFDLGDLEGLPNDFLHRLESKDDRGRVGSKVIGIQDESLVSTAKLRTEELMAKTPENVTAFLEDLDSQLQPGAQAESRVLRGLKAEHLRELGGDFDGKFYVWDLNFYHRLMLETQYLVKQEEISEYFELQTTVSAMLEMLECVFGLAFREITSEPISTSGGDMTWHEDVLAFEAWDSTEQGGGFLGYMYLDLFARDDKYGGIANFNLQPGFIKADGTRHYPTTVLVCNFEKPQPGRPSLLKHIEVCMLFHELGHGIHDLVAKTTYSQFHGTACADDFCEAPSQMLERWSWSAKPLRFLSRHYSTLSPEYRAHWEATQNMQSMTAPPDELADHMIEGLLQGEIINAALANLKSLHRAVFDKKVHAPPDRTTLESMDFTKLFNTLQREIVGLDAPSDPTWGHGQAQVFHLMEGYDASFHGYLYSKVFASDMFTAAFKRDPLNTEVGQRYRQCVLEKGGSEDEMALLIDFLGRAPSSHAFKTDLGIASDA